MTLPRVLFAPLNVANDPSAVSRALREMGFDADLATVDQARYVSSGDFDLSWPNLGTLGRFARKAHFVARALRRYDVLHYSFARSILDYDLPGAALIDLRIAHHLGKVCVMTFHGCDVRGIAGGACGWCEAPCDIAAKRRRWSLIRRHVGAVSVTTPDLLVDVPEARWIPQAVDFVEHAPHVPPAASGCMTIIHAPSDSSLKGTSHVIAACNIVKERGWDVRLQLVENMDRTAALRAYESADIAIDQLHVGWYGVFAVEMMALGKPVVCRIDSAYVRRAGISPPPIVDADPLSLADVLEALLRDRTMLAELGLQGRRYAKRVHAPDAVARQYIELYEQADGGSRLRRPDDGNRPR